MNYGMFDAQNFAWKFHQLQNGFAAPSLLDTYEQERRKAANQLLDFDIRYARLFSSRPEAEKEKSKGEETEFMKLHQTAAHANDLSPIGIEIHVAEKQNRIALRSYTWRNSHAHDGNPAAA